MFTYETLFSILAWDEILVTVLREPLSYVNYKIAPHSFLPVLIFMLNFFKRKKKEDMACFTVCHTCVIFPIIRLFSSLSVDHAHLCSETKQNAWWDQNYAQDTRSIEIQSPIGPSYPFYCHSLNSFWFLPTRWRDNRFKVSLFSTRKAMAPTPALPGKLHGQRSPGCLPWGR